MKKIAFLSCDDLTSYVVDDNYLYTAIVKLKPNFEYQVVSWSDPTVDWSDFNVAVIRTTWDYTKRKDEFLTKLKEIQASGCEIFNSLEIVEWNSRKSYLKDLKKSKVQIIESYFLDEETSDTLIQKTKDGIKYVLKPIVGATAESIQVLSKEDLLKEFEVLDSPAEWFVQPFKEEIKKGERSLFYFNSKYSHACKKVPKEGDFRVQEEHGGIITSYTPTTEDFQFAEQVLKSIGEKLLYARIDFIATSNGCELIELELIEPSLYFRTNEQAAFNFIEALEAL